MRVLKSSVLMVTAGLGAPLGRLRRNRGFAGCVVVKQNSGIFGLHSRSEEELLGQNCV